MCASVIDYRSVYTHQSPDLVATSTSHKQGFLFRDCQYGIKHVADINFPVGSSVVPDCGTVGPTSSTHGPQPAEYAGGRRAVHASRKFPELPRIGPTRVFTGRALYGHCHYNTTPHCCIHSLLSDVHNIYNLTPLDNNSIFILSNYFIKVSNRITKKNIITQSKPWEEYLLIM